MKHYEKPQLFMEEFTMAESIARCGANHPGDYEDNMEWALGGDGKVTTNMWADSCSADFWLFDTHYNVFLSAACDTMYGENDGYEAVCYQSNNGEGWSLFHS